MLSEKNSNFAVKGGVSVSDDDHREQLQTTFGEDAELYHRARPTYPDELFDDLRRDVGMGQGCRVLEIGSDELCL